MNFNYSYEKKKFEQEWAKLEKEYREAAFFIFAVYRAVSQHPQFLIPCPLKQPYH